MTTESLDAQKAVFMELQKPATWALGHAGGWNGDPASRFTTQLRAAELCARSGDYQTAATLLRDAHALLRTAATEQQHEARLAGRRGSFTPFMRRASNREMPSRRTSSVSATRLVQLSLDPAPAPNAF